MEKEQLNEELTEEVAGGAEVNNKYKNFHDYIKSLTVNVKCAKCGKEFDYTKFPIVGMGISAVGAWRVEAQKRTCPSCGYVNSSKELGI